MKPLHYGSRSPKPGDKLLLGKPGPVVATVTPKGPRLKLQPVLDRILVSHPDAGQEEPNMIGGVHLPGVATRQQFIANAKVTVEAVGPDVKQVKVGNEVIVPRAAVQQVSMDGQSYWWINEAGVLGIVQEESAAELAKKLS